MVFYLLYILSEQKKKVIGGLAVEFAAVEFKSMCMRLSLLGHDGASELLFEMIVTILAVTRASLGQWDTMLAEKRILY